MNHDYYVFDPKVIDADAMRKEARRNWKTLQERSTIHWHHVNEMCTVNQRHEKVPTDEGNV